jgi:PTS system galactitol-specific IIC component
MPEGVMEMQAAIQYMLDLGAPIVLPIIMILIGLLFGVGFRRAFGAGLMLGVAFSGMNIILGFMFNAIGPAASAFVENTGIQLTYIDLGWTPTAAIAWAWPYAFLMFPVQIVINLAMLALGWTSTLNVDMWNVWNKVLTGVLVAGVSGSVPLAFVFCAIQVVWELKQADWSANILEEATGIPGVVLPHSLFFEWIIMLPLSQLLDRIPWFQKQRWSPEDIRERIGIFGENHVIGFVVGVFIAAMARYDLKGILTLGIQSGTALTIFPMVARLFITALMPIADGAKEFMAARFPGREFYIGLDWPFTAGLSSMWVAGIINVPFFILAAMILPGNRCLPFGGILHMIPAMIVAICLHNDVLRAIVLVILTLPIWFFAGNYFADSITTLARAVETVDIPAGVEGITWIGMECPTWRVAVASLADLITNGKIMPAIIAVPAVALLFWYSSGVLRRLDREAAERLGKGQAS